MRSFFLFLLFFAHLSSQLNGQNIERLFITDYGNKDYKSSLSNFQVIQDYTGLIYVANLNGLLVFDGKKWSNHSEDQNIISSLLSTKSNSLYYGAKNDFGYITSDNTGQINFISLSESLSNAFEGVVWKILEGELGYVYFYTTQGIFIWNGNSLKVYPNTDQLSYKPSLNKLDTRIYVNSVPNGLYSFTNDSINLVEGTRNLSGKLIRLISGNSDSLFLQTNTRESVILKNNSISEIINSEILKDKIQTITQLPNQEFAIGYDHSGLQIMNNNFKNLGQINKSNGLKSENIKSITSDSEKNIWLATQDGIAHIRYNSPWHYFEKNNDPIGSPWTVGQSKQNVYLGSTSGLYKISKGVINETPIINGHVWTIKAHKDQLLIGTKYSLYQLMRNGTLKPYPSIQSVSMIYSDQNSHAAIGTLNGIDVLFEKDGTFHIQNSIDIKLNTYSSITEDLTGNLWATSKYNGIYRISGWKTKNPSMQLYNKDNGISDISNPSLLIINGQVHVTNQQGLLVYDSLTDSFKQVIDLHRNIQLAQEIRKNEFAITSLNVTGELKVEKIHFKKDYKYDIDSKCFSLPQFSDILSVYPSQDSTIWFATFDGLYKYDEKVKKDYTVPFNTLIRKVTSIDSLIFVGSYSTTSDSSIVPSFVLDQPKSFEPTLAYENNSIRFEYAATSYELPEKNMYSYYLGGNDKNWSAWSTENVKEYNNLSAGSYMFQVKSKNIYGTEGRTAIYRFTIETPWYQTTWAFGLFGLSGLAFIWFIVLAYTYRVRLQRKKLKLIVADRTFEVLTQKKEIEKQNVLLQNKNEEITQQRDNINEKNQELQMSQEEILSINEKLHELNSLLEKKVEQRTSKIKSTLKQLQKTNAELDTFIYRASHDLKGPISRIHGLTSLAKLESTSPNDLKYYNLIELVSKDMQKLLSKLTLVHEVLNHQIELHPIDLPVVISGVRDSIKFLDSTEITKYSFELETALQLNSDPFLISIILSNLMENSLIFRKNYPGIEQSITVRSHQDNDNIYLVVSDTGIGIAQEQIEKIFNMFFRGSDQSKGSGLGLYLVRMAVEKLNGAIQVESQFGESTTFSVVIPKNRL